jgi:hypothetical protein
MLSHATRGMKDRPLSIFRWEGTMMAMPSIGSPMPIHHCKSFWLALIRCLFVDLLFLCHRSCHADRPLLFGFTRNCDWMRVRGLWYRYYGFVDRIPAMIVSCSGMRWTDDAGLRRDTVHHTPTKSEEEESNHQRSRIERRRETSRTAAGLQQRVVLRPQGTTVGILLAFPF